MLGREFSNIDKYAKAFNQLDSKGKYEYLKGITPEIIRRTKIGHIASIIGVSRETGVKVKDFTGSTAKERIVTSPFPKRQGQIEGFFPHVGYRNNMQAHQNRTRKWGQRNTVHITN